MFSPRVFLSFDHRMAQAADDKVDCNLFMPLTRSLLMSVMPGPG
jgi:hypothetical protein